MFDVIFPSITCFNMFLLERFDVWTWIRVDVVEEKILCKTHLERTLTRVEALKIFWQ